MKHFSQSAICCLLIFLPTSLAGGWGQDLSQFDLSTKEGVNAAREAIAGKKLDERSKNCVRLDSDLPGIAVVGGFAYDYGCRVQGVFVKSRYFEKDDTTLSKSALDSLGWKTANPQQRQKLVRAWVEKGLLAFLSVPGEKDKDFGERSFQPPQATSKADGETIVRLWIRMPSGRNRGRSYQLREYKFSKDGDLAGSATLESFSVSKDGDG